MEKKSRDKLNFKIVIPIIIAIVIAVTVIVITEALPVIATQPTDSPYVVLGQPPKIAPAIEPTPSPKSVL